MFIAIALPFFGGLLGFFGGFALAPTSYYVSENRMASHVCAYMKIIIEDIRFQHPVNNRLMLIY